jgi:hypothetical protein
MKAQHRFITGINKPENSKMLPLVINSAGEKRSFMKFFGLLLLILVFTCSVFAQKSQLRLQGTWEGDGVQMDGSTWTMKLRVRNNRYFIEYPSLKCRGYWKPISTKSKRTRFLERIPNSSVCLDKLTVQVERINTNQLNVKYSSTVDNFSATAVLQRVRKDQYSATANLLINYEKQTWALAERKELDKFASFIAENFTGIYPDADNVTKAQLMQSLGAITLKNYELTDFKVKMLTKDAAIVTYKAASTVLADGKESSARVDLTAGWAKRLGKWQIVFFRETPLK